MAAPAAVARWLIALAGEHGDELQALEVRLGDDCVYDHRVKQASLLGEPERAADVADTLHEAATSDAEGREGSTAYTVIAVTSSGEEKCPKKLICKGAALDSNGIVREVFAQNRQLINILVKDRETSSQHSNQLINMVMGRNVELERGRVEFVQWREAILDRSAAREQEAEAAKKRDEHIAAGLKTAKLLAPAIVSHFTGQKMPGATTPREALIDEFMAQIEPDQLMLMMQHLTPAQRAALFTLMGAEMPPADDDDMVPDHNAGYRDPGMVKKDVT